MQKICTVWKLTNCRSFIVNGLWTANTKIVWFASRLSFVFCINWNNETVASGSRASIITKFFYDFQGALSVTVYYYCFVAITQDNQRQWVPKLRTREYLGSSFTAYMPFLVVTSASSLGILCYSSPQQYYLHHLWIKNSCLHVINFICTTQHYTIRKKQF